MKAGGSQRDERCSYTRPSKENPKLHFVKGSLLWCKQKHTNLSACPSEHPQMGRIYILPHINSGNMFLSSAEPGEQLLTSDTACCRDELG